MTRKRPRRRARDVRPISKGRRIDIRRDEFKRVVDLLNEREEILKRLQRDQEIQFQRIAQIQLELDSLKRAIDQRD